MKFSADNASDVKKYFAGSYVKFPMSGDTLHFIDEIRNNIIKGRYYGPNEETGAIEEQVFQFFLYTDEMMTQLGEQQPEVEYVMPKKSYFNHDGRACLLYRIPARQYHRGVTEENTAIRQLTTSGDFEIMNVRFPVLHSYVSKQAFGSFSPLISGSKAVSPRIAYTAGGMIFADQVRIGSINFGERTITANNPLFVPELTKLAGQFEVVLPTAVKKDKKVAAKKMKSEEYNDEEVM